MKKVYKWYIGILIFLLVMAMVIPASIFGWKTRIEQIRKEYIEKPETREEIVEVETNKTQAEIYFEEAANFYSENYVGSSIRIMQFAIYYQNQEIIRLLKELK